MTTFVAVLVFGTGILLSVLLSAWLLRLGARWAKISDVSYKRAVVAVVLMNAAILVIQFGSLPWLRQTSLAALVAELVLGLIVVWKVVQWTLRTTFGRAIVAWLPTLLANAVGLGLVLGVVRPFFFEAFVVSANSMAPTIVGRHYRSVCPSCGGVSIVSASELGAPVAEEDLGICESCLRAAKVTVSDTTPFSADRFAAAKFLRPRRWNLIVFRYPEAPSNKYVKRLVGLPGEEVAIRDGDVWINGVVAQKPDDLSGLVYSADPMWEERTDWGPVRLGIDEYFVLGDFSLRSKDSRLWQEGAPGHPPYAVPQSHLVGVVTHIYWPPSRWRIFR